MKHARSCPRACTSTSLQHQNVPPPTLSVDMNGMHGGSAWLGQASQHSLVLCALLLTLLHGHSLAVNHRLSRASTDQMMTSTSTVIRPKLSTATAEEELPGYLRSGPYQVVTTLGSVVAALKTSCGSNQCTLKLTLSSPARNPTLEPGSVPIVLMFNGFQLPSAYYHVYAHAMATWGYACLQYDLPGSLFKAIIRDDDEISKVLPLLLAWLQAQCRDASTAVYEILDIKRIAVFGHSRGAKLSTLIFADSTWNVSAAILVDPVDMSAYTRREHYPSATDALAHNPRKALLIGAGITGVCNPMDEGWRKYWRQLQPGSWLMEILPAGHGQFLEVKGLVAWGIDKLCRAGNVTHRTVMHVTQGAAIAWLEAAFRPERSSQELPAYMSWVKAQQGGPLLNFTTM